MQYVCDGGGRKTWFRLETEAEAAAESDVLKHAVEKYFRREKAAAEKLYQSTSGHSIERDIGLNAHIARTMPMFLTLREHDGTALATAMLPPGGKDGEFRIIIVGAANGDPYPAQSEAITALGTHFGLSLPRERCFPYQTYGV
jgi:hypothetical protein